MSVGISVRGVWRTYCAVGRYCTQFAGPLLVVGLFRRRRVRMISGLLLAAPLGEAYSGVLKVDPVRFVVGYLADHVAYGAGVWVGCLRERAFTAIYPKVIIPRWFARVRDSYRVRRKGFMR